MAVVEIIMHWLRCQRWCTLAALIGVPIIVWIIGTIGRHWRARKLFVETIERIPGPPVHPFMPWLGHTIILLYLDAQQFVYGTYVLIYQMISATHKVYPNNGICRMWIGVKPFVLLYSPENVECILTNAQLTDKASEYRFLEPWLGQGLVTSARNKWRQRRKILTPAFHFKILTDFLPIINDEATVLVKKLSRSFVSDDDHDASKAVVFDLTPVITLCTLDTICETAMGIKINCQESSHSEYVDSLHELGELVLIRVMRPWLWPDFLFYLTSHGRKFRRCLDRMHKFTMDVIVERKQAWQAQLDSERQQRSQQQQQQQQQRRQSIDNEKSNNETSINSMDEIRESAFFKDNGKRLAFLDLLLQQHMIANTLTIEDVREEVDTFMFAGHDTTAMAISWTLYMLGLHQDIQDKVRHELDQVLAAHPDNNVIICDDEQQAPGDTSVDEQNHLSSHNYHRLCTDDITTDQVCKMKYLDCVLKEVQRLWPTAPFIARQVTQEVTVPEGFTIPVGATCVIFTHMLHRNPRVFDQPEVFNPDRFLPENCIHRHPFAYVPFSAGPRNCIGQKFAQLEQKVIVAKVIRNFYVKAQIQRDKLAIVGEMVLRTRNGLNVKLVPRYKS